MTFFTRKSCIYPIIAVMIGYLIKKSITIITIPENMIGWIVISILGPLITALISPSTWSYITKNHLFNSQTYEQKIHGFDVMEWLMVYMVNNHVWSHGTFNKIIRKNCSIWWSDDDWNTRPQIVEIPSNWIIFKYGGKYLFAHFPAPTKSDSTTRVRLYYEMTVWSFQKISWKKFLEDVRDHHFSNSLDDGKMMYYRIDGSRSFYEEIITSIRPDTSIDLCFGNPAKERAWKLVNEFLTPRKKDHYKKLRQIYNTSFLIYGPPGTGKSEFIFLLASHTWATHHKPIYIINPRGMDDADLENAIAEISSGYVLINEWDLVLASVARDYDLDNDEEQKRLPQNEKYPSIKAWLDILDQARGEIIFWFTTNNYKKLAKINDGALIRDGRIDHRIEFSSMDVNESRNALKYFYSDQHSVIEKIVDQDLKDLNIAKIIKNLKCEYPIEYLFSKKKT